MFTARSRCLCSCSSARAALTSARTWHSPICVASAAGRWKIDPDDLRDDVLYQIGALDGFIRAEGGTMRHVKPHGSLSAMCGRREDYARAPLGAVATCDKNLIVIVGQGWPQRLAGEYGLTVVYDGHIDLDYQPDGCPRVEPVKQFRDPDDVVRCALVPVREQSATVLD